MSLLLATFCAGLFAGAASYINLVEHPARLSCGTDVALKEFAPSYERASRMQASLALVGLILGIVASLEAGDPWTFGAALALGAVVPFTLLVIRPTNERLLDPSLDGSSPVAAMFLRRWARLHAVRSLLAALSFIVFLCRLTAAAAP